MEGMMLAQWGPKHAELRDAVGDTFTSRNVNCHIELVRSTIARLLDEWVPKGSFDFAALASYFPIAEAIKRFGPPADVEAVGALLMSDEGAFIACQVIAVNGEAVCAHDGIRWSWPESGSHFVSGIEYH